MQTSCPICGAAVRPARENAAAPFCSRQCRLIDLGSWLGGNYRVPSVDAPSAEAVEQASVEE